MGMSEGEGQIFKAEFEKSGFSKLTKEYAGELENSYQQFKSVFSDARVRSPKVKEAVSNGDAETLRRELVDRKVMSSEDVDNMLYSSEKDIHEVLDDFKDRLSKEDPVLMFGKKVADELKLTQPKAKSVEGEPYFKEIFTDTNPKPTPAEIDAMNKASKADFEEKFGKQALPSDEPSKIIGPDGKVMTREYDISEFKQVDNSLKKSYKLGNAEAAKEYREIFKPPSPNSVKTKLTQFLEPIKNQDKGVRDIFRTWTRKKLIGKELANVEIPKIKIPNVDGMQVIHDYQAGRPTAFTEQLKKVFDEFYNEAAVRGLDIPYRQNYLPQVYKESPKEIQETMARYMTDNNVDADVIKAYLDGTGELDEEIVRRLKLNPTFIQERAFPSYQVAMEHGLTPRYTNPAQLVAHYRNELEQSIANREFLDALIKNGKIFPADIAPSDFQPINLPFSPKGYYGAPELADMLNGLFRDDNSLSLGQWAVSKVSWLSKGMQEVMLSAGLPNTQINFFSMGQLIKEITAGNFKAVVPFVRGNWNPAVIKYFEENAPLLKEMAEEGIDVGSRVGNYEEVYSNIIKNPNILGRISDSAKLFWKKSFNEKPFGSFMPQLYVQTFKDAKAAMLLKGLDEAKAKQVAAETIRNFYGIYENGGRSKTAEDTLSSVFFAPRFREGIVNSFINNGRAGVDFVQALGGFRKPLDLTLGKNRQLLLGMVLTYAGYNAANYKLAGHYMWDNPPGKEFALQIPLENGDIVYTEFMPSYLSFARNMASGAIGLVKGDFNTAGQKFGSLFSAPIKLVSEVTSNRDYFGRPIYKDTDSGGIKLKKIAEYIGLQVNHPFVREVYRQIATDKPAYQSVSEALELPFKFSSWEKTDKQDYYSALDAQSKKRAQATEPIKKAYEQMLKLDAEGKKEEADQLFKDTVKTKEQYQIYKSLKAADKRADTVDKQAQMLRFIKKLQELDAQGKSDESDKLFKSTITNEADYKIYQATKKKLNL